MKEVRVLAEAVTVLREHPEEFVLAAILLLPAADIIVRFSLVKLLEQHLVVVNYLRHISNPVASIQRAI